MAFTCALAVVLGRMEEEQAQRFLQVTVDRGVPLTDPRLTDESVQQGFNVAVVHRGGSLNLPLPVEIGVCIFIEDIAALPGGAVEEAFACLHSYGHRQRARAAAR